jgi:predicted DNA-binding transcriptional regulator AlpA
MGKKFITTKEASKRYGMSVEWFKKRRNKKLCPKFIQLSENGVIFYPFEETENWFKKQIEMKIGG